MSPVLFASDDWIQALFAAAKASTELCASISDFEGPMTLVIEAQTPHLPTGRVIWLDVGLSEIRAVEAIANAEAKPTKYVLTGSYELWQKIAQGKQGIIKAVMFGRLNVKGSKTTLLKHVTTASLLSKLLTELPTRFP